MPVAIICGGLLYLYKNEMAGINRFTVDSGSTSAVTGIFNESVCGLVFDISNRSGVFNNYALARQNYGNERIVKLSSMDDVVASGITEGGVMGGVPYYHLNQFFTMASKDTAQHDVYVVFADCRDGFQIFNRVSHETGKKVFQFGLWTERDLFDYRGDVIVSPLLAQLSADLFSFREVFQKSDEYDLDIPFNVLMCANPSRTETVDTVIRLTDIDNVRLADQYGYNLTARLGANIGTFDYLSIPSLTGFDIPGLTVLLGQERSEEVHNMQFRNFGNTPVGCVGAALGVLALSPVEYSMADNYLFSLKDVIPVAELGFGPDNMPLDKLGYVRRNSLDAKGYVFPVDKDGYYGETFFSSDRTLGSRDYSTLSRCRTINKVHRIVRGTLIKHVNGPVSLNPATGGIAQSESTRISNEVYDAIDEYMGVGSNMSGSAQLDFRRVTVTLKNDTDDGYVIMVEVEIRPGSHAESVILTEEVSVS